MRIEVLTKLDRINHDRCAVNIIGAELSRLSSTDAISGASIMVTNLIAPIALLTNGFAVY